MRHMTGSVYGIFEKPVNMYRGTTMAGIIQDEARNDPSRGFVGGYELETLSLGLPFMAAFLDPGAWGRSFTSALDGYDHMAGMWIVGEDMPQETNAITLHPSEKDQFGLAVPNVHFDDHANDIAMRNHAYKQGSAVYDAVGAIRTFPTPPYPSTHNLGTNRMSEKPRDGVVNKWGQTHDVSNLFISDGSQFTTGAAENPTLTIVALAIRQADHIAGRMQRGELRRYDSGWRRCVTSPADRISRFDPLDVFLMDQIFTPSECLDPGTRIFARMPVTHPLVIGARARSYSYQHSL
jgi:choline dehydrogenase-like flavoprotein